MGELLLSWQGIVLILVGLAVILVLVTLELFSVIILFDDVLKGHQQNVFRQTISDIGSAFAVLPRFFRPSGLLILLYLVIALPLIGVRFLMSFNRLFRIPNFIMETIESNTFFSVLYCAVIAALAVIGFLYAFSVYGVIIDELKPAEAARKSLRMVRTNLRTYLFGLIKMILIMGVIGAGSWLVFRFLPGWLVSLIGEETLKSSGQAETYHFFMILIVIGGVVLYNLVGTMLLSYFLLRYARFYDDFSKNRTRNSFEPRTSRGKNIPFVISLTLMGIFWIGASFYLARNFDSVITDTGNTRIIAHRTGGVSASENSVEGIVLAAENGCEGSETDIRRTKDGQYVINHDNTFSRLTGDDRRPEDMTADEIRMLKIRDTTGNGQLLPVPFLEDLLNAAAGRIRLYIEMKGITADEQMADDVVKLVNEHYQPDEVALISLDYDVIRYVETHYPDYLTGVLMFQGFGDFEDMDCDIIMMEEDMLTDERIEKIHQAGKQVAVWTVNTKDGLRRAMSMGVDAVITDQIERANSVMEEIRSRTDLDIVEDYLYYHLGLD